MGYQDFYGNYDHVLNNLKSAWEDLADTRRQLAEANAKIKYYEALYEDVDHIVGLEVELAQARKEIARLKSLLEVRFFPTSSVEFIELKTSCCHHWIDGVCEYCGDRSQSWVSKNQ